MKFYGDFDREFAPNFSEMDRFGACSTGVALWFPHQWGYLLLIRKGFVSGFFVNEEICSSFDRVDGSQMRRFVTHSTGVGLWILHK